MIIRQLSLQNFMGYRQRCDLDLRGKQTVGIVGNNESGKSTLLSAICYLLFGDVPILNQETREVHLISDGTTADLLVEGEVELTSGEVLGITRGRTKSNSPIVRLDGHSGKPSDLSYLIEEKVGLPFEDFVALSYFVQGDIHQFMDGSKRDYFQRWAWRLKRWELYEDAAKTHTASLEQERDRRLREVQDSKVGKEDRDEAQRELEAARQALAEAESSEALIRQQTDALVEQAAQTREKQAAAAGEARGASREEHQTTQLVASLKQRVASLDRQAQEAKASLCPILKQPCSKITERGEERRSEARREAGLAREELKQAEAQLEELQEARRLREAEAHRQDEESAPLRQQQRALAESKQALGEATSACGRAQARVGRAEERISRLQQLREKAKAAQARVDELEADIRRGNFVAAMCGRSGIPLEVMDAELQAVEDKGNWVLSRLDYPKRLRFAASRELATLVRVCPHCGGERWARERCSDCGAPRPHKRKDEPTVTVLEGSVERPFALESGGARVLQSFAVRLACSLFRASMTGTPVQMVMLDEVFAMLDSGNRQKLMALVIGKLASEFGLRQQLVVSHQEDVVNAVDDILVVEKRGGSSVAHWA